MTVVRKALWDTVDDLEGVFNLWSYETEVETMVYRLLTVFDYTREGLYETALVELENFEGNKEVEYLVSGVKSSVLCLMNGESEILNSKITSEQMLNFHMKVFLRYLKGV